MRNWRNAIVRWRCGLNRAQVARLRGGRVGRWNCHDLKITVARISFGDLGATRAKTLNDVPTSFTLPVKSVDALTQAGSDALKGNAAFQRFLKEM